MEQAIKFREGEMFFAFKYNLSRALTFWGGSKNFGGVSFTGLDYWTAILDWTTGLSYFSFLCTSEQILPFYLDCQWLMHNIILSVAYCCNCICSVLSYKQPHRLSY